MDVKQGMTFTGWSPYLGILLFLLGVIFIVGGFAADPFLFLPGGILSFFGMVIFMNLRGTTIDFAGKRCRMYQDFVLFRVGRWVDLSFFTHVSVTRFREQFSHTVGRDLGRNAHIRTYFVALRGDKISIHLNEVETRKEAVALAEQISGKGGLLLDDRSAPPVPRADRRR